MDHGTCNVLYVDRRVGVDRVVRRQEDASGKGTGRLAPSCPEVSGEHPEVTANIQALLANFDQVYVCSSGAACRTKTSELNDIITADLTPTLVLVEITTEELITDENCPPSPDELKFEVTEQSLYGVSLLQWLASETHYRNLSKLFIPIAVVSCSQSSTSISTSMKNYTFPGEKSLDSTEQSAGAESTSSLTLDTGQMLAYLDSGAADVLPSPFIKERIAGLAIHAYRAHKEVAKDQKTLVAVQRGRKRSWVGVDDEKPFAYLREAMVSGLMDGICKPQTVAETFEFTRILITPERRVMVAQAIGSWNFSAHDLTEDELLHAASLMLQHALTMPALEQWRITMNTLTAFLIATRTAYNSFVPYHNFRHVVDVLQAIFYFLLQLGTLPPYPGRSRPASPNASCPIASLLRPFDALTLLITAIGHDVGHPGVNNAFLVALNAPLAQLYNDRSVLESFHCAAFSQILRRYWPASFESPEMRSLLINSILATDMGLHFDYMKKLGALAKKLEEGTETTAWDAKYRDEQRALVCSLLIKCADISNVARPHAVAAQWATILTDEFARQASMEDDLGIPSALFAPPVRDSIVEMGKSQVGFMSIFALPLFQGVTGVMPAMRFSVDEMTTNKSIWESKIISGRETERLQQHEVAPQLDSYRLTPRSKGSHTASVPLSTGLSPSSHVKTPSGRHSPKSSLTTPTRASPEESRRSSHGTIRHPVTNGASSAPNHTTHMVHAAPLSPPSSKGATLPAVTQSESSAAAFSAASDIAAESERVEKRSSSSAYSSPTPLSNTSVTTNASSHSSKSQVDRGSSAATSSELQPRMSPASANMSITNGVSASHLNARTCIARRRSADHSILAVLVTSSGQSLPKATATSGVASDHCQASHDPKHVRRRSSGKSSLPSSPEWASQINSPGHDLGAMTPTTAGTSFRSVESTEQAMSKGHGSVLPSPTETDDGSERENGGASVVYGNGNGNGHGHGHMNDHEKDEKDRRKGAGHGYVTGPKQTSEEWTTSGMDSERERERDEKERQRLRHRNSRWKLKFWKGGKRIVSEAV